MKINKQILATAITLIAAITAVIGAIYTYMKYLGFI